MYKTLVKPLIFLIDPERAHKWAFALLRLGFCIPFVSHLIKKRYCIEHKGLERTVFGIRFKNPVGLAAGFDKNAKLFNQLSAFGFGFVEIGTVTPQPQAGNPKKRLFRLLKDKALINRMGFNNEGVAGVVRRLKKNRGTLVGANIGKNKDTPNEQALEDYKKCFCALYPYVDYFAVNVSSPNTPYLRALQEREPLTALLEALQAENIQRGAKPILLKIAPDLTNSQLEEIIAIVKETGIAGVIATNTTTLREELRSENKEEAGGLSGKPLQKRSTEVIRFLAEKSGKVFSIIGVGGIMTVEDALEKLDAGADLVQLYTGFVYEGPRLVKAINQALLVRDGLSQGRGL